jgi:segregation and condensation protein B
MPDGFERRPDVEREPSMRAILEALVYASPDPVDLAELKEAFGADRATEVEGALAGLLEEYRAEGRGLTIEQVAGGYRITTRPEMAGVLREFVKRRNRTRLSRAALETLALVAYRQPVTAPEVEAVRGVNPSSILKSLLERRMIRILGRKKVVGKPFLYGTTPEFLEHFGLNSLDDLPSLEEFAGLLEGAPVPAQDEPAPGAADREGAGEREGSPPATGSEIET